MKYLKKYETIDSAPQIGDYIVCKDDIYNHSSIQFGDELSDFVSSNVGKIIQKNSVIYDYIVKYEDLPEKLERYCGYGKSCIGILNKVDIALFSPNKQDVETFLALKKFNI